MTEPGVDVPLSERVTRGDFWEEELFRTDDLVDEVAALEARIVELVNDLDHQRFLLEEMTEARDLLLRERDDLRKTNTALLEVENEREALAEKLAVVQRDAGVVIADLLREREEAVAALERIVRGEEEAPIGMSNPAALARSALSRLSPTEKEDGS